MIHMELQLFSFIGEQILNNKSNNLSKIQKHFHKVKLTYLITNIPRVNIFYFITTFTIYSYY